MTAANAGSLNFDGSSAQSLSGSANYFANNVVVNNANGVSINTPLKVDSVFNFKRGIVSAATTANAITFTSSGSISSTFPPSDTSHINGDVVKEGIGSFAYPVGNGTRYQKVDVNLSANSNGMQVVYKPSDAGTAPFSTAGTDPTPLLYYNTYEHWDISPIGTATGTVTIYYDSYNNSGISSISDLKVAHKSGGNWLNEGTTATGTASSGSVTSNSLSTWSPFTLGSINPSSPLPMHLLSFNGLAKQGYNQLNWETANEEDVQSYELQRCTDGTQYETINKSVAQNLSKNLYTYIDSILFTGNLFYRLKMNTINNISSYSNTVRFNHKSVGKESFVFPNPAQDNIFLTVSDEELINSKAVLFDIQGRRIQEIIVSSKMVNINISYCARGTYILSLANEEVFHIVKNQ